MLGLPLLLLLLLFKVITLLVVGIAGDVAFDVGVSVVLSLLELDSAVDNVVEDGGSANDATGLKAMVGGVDGLRTVGSCVECDAMGEGVIDDGFFVLAPMIL